MSSTLPISSETLQIQHVFGLATNDTLTTFAELVAIVEHKRTAWKLVVHELPRLPNNATWLQQVCELLADAALQNWPGWAQADSAIDVHDCRWLQFANRLAREGKRPLSAKFSRSYQLRKLCRVLAAEKLAIALLVPAQQVDDERLLGLAKGAEWLAREANACVLVVVDPALAERNALDSLTFEECNRGEVVTGHEPPTASQSVAVLPDGCTAKPVLDEHKLVHPCLGRPHPGSPGEQQLYAALEVDSQLAGLFKCNEHVDTVRNTSPIVDLVWTEGKVVVEVDGYRFHSNRTSFRNDRERDYALVISGYLVLRLPHDEVILDPLLAVEKIRDVVNYRIASTLITQNDSIEKTVRNSKGYQYQNCW